MLRDNFIQLLLGAAKKLDPGLGLLKVSGNVDIIRTDEYGDEVQKVSHKNLVVDTGLYHFADQLALVHDETEMGYMSIGSNNTAAAAGDTALYNELGRVALAGRVQGTGGNSNQVTYTATFPAGTGTGSIVEAGVLNAAAAGILAVRSVFATITKAAGDTLDITWTVTFAAA